MTLLESTRCELNERKGQWRAIERATGLSYGWLRKLATGETPNPGIESVQTLADHFAANPRPTEPKQAPA